MPIFYVKFVSGIVDLFYFYWAVLIVLKYKEYAIAFKIKPHLTNEIPIYVIKI